MYEYQWKLMTLKALGRPTTVWEANVKYVNIFISSLPCLHLSFKRFNFLLKTILLNHVL